MARMLNRVSVTERLAKVPAVMTRATDKQLVTEVAALATAQKRNAPVDETSERPGALRDSLHYYANPKRPLSYRILADAKDADGKFIGSNVDAGHRTPEGKHVPGANFFFTIYRALKKGMRRRISAASLKAAKTAFPR